jgi:alcohol dehydrogenase, propanol-preferring
MKAMVLVRAKQPLVLQEVPKPSPVDKQVLIKVHACGVCRTDVHIADGELKEPHYPLILGHQIVGVIEKMGPEAGKYKIGDRVGALWLGLTCHKCPYCLHNQENLCDNPVFTGYTQNGGFTEYCAVHEDYIVPIPSQYDDLHAAPLLCAGLIGYRAFRLAGDFETLGLYGFGSSAHLLLQVAHALGKKTFVFTRAGDSKTQEFATSLGAFWVGGSDEMPPEPLDAALIFAPVGALYPQALKAVKKGGRVISAGIHMSDIPSFPYQLLWEERVMSSVANLTRDDAKEFIALAGKIPLKVSVSEFPLEKANEALDAIRRGGVDGSCVLKIS